MSMDSNPPGKVKVQWKFIVREHQSLDGAPEVAVGIDGDRAGRTAVPIRGSTTQQRSQRVSQDRSCSKSQDLPTWCHQ